MKSKILLLSALLLPLCALAQQAPVPAPQSPADPEVLQLQAFALQGMVQSDEAQLKLAAKQIAALQKRIAELEAQIPKPPAAATPVPAKK